MGQEWREGIVSGPAWDGPAVHRTCQCSWAHIAVASSAALGVTGRLATLCSHTAMLHWSFPMSCELAQIRLAHIRLAHVAPWAFISEPPETMVPSRSCTGAVCEAGVWCCSCLKAQSGTNYCMSQSSQCLWVLCQTSSLAEAVACRQAVMEVSFHCF